MRSWYLPCVIEFNDAERTQERRLDNSEVSELQTAMGLRFARENLDRLPQVVYARPTAAAP